MIKGYELREYERSFNREENVTSDLTAHESPATVLLEIVIVEFFLKTIDFFLLFLTDYKGLFTLQASQSARRLAAIMFCDICTERCLTVPTTRSARQRSTPKKLAVIFAIIETVTIKHFFK